MLDVIVALGFGFIAVAIFFVIAGIVGIFRFKSTLQKMHPAGVIDSAALIFLAIGALMITPLGFISIKIIFLLLFALITSATACHILAQITLAEDCRDDK